MKNKRRIIVFAIVLLLIIVSGLIIFGMINKQEEEEVIETYISDSMSIKTYKENDYYIIIDDYSGEYDLQTIKLSRYLNASYNTSEIREKAKTFEKKEVMNYDEYKAYCNEWGLDEVYLDISKNYIVFSYVAYHSPNANARLAEVEYNGDGVNLYIWDEATGVTADVSAYCVIVPTENEIDTINVVGVHTNEEFNNIKKFGTSYDPRMMSVDKPVIYLYPTKETEVSVKLLNPERITCSYPKYIDGWEVLAEPNGDLIDLDTGRNLYSLYYESEAVGELTSYEEGFVIAGEDSAKFLEEKLEILGLTEREAQEFIIYWLPKLESNKYNYIRFASNEEISNNMSLEIKPVPDTTIRIWMLFKGLDESIKVEEQELLTVERNGFTVVEWGGTEIK